MVRIQNLLKFRKNDPLRYLHVPDKKQLDHDERPLDDGDHEVIDFEWYENHPDGVVS